MSTTISQASGMKYQGSAPADQVTTVNEAKQGKAADGSAAPKGATPVVVEPGDTISDIMTKYGLDWNNKADREQFLKDNPQFADQAGERNPDQIWPGEVVYVRNPENDGAGKGDQTDGPDKTGKTPADKDPPKSESPGATAGQATDAAAKDLQDAEQRQADYMRTPGPKGFRGEFEADVNDKRQILFDTIQKEVETGLADYVNKNPEASAEDIRNEANRLRHEIQGRSPMTAGLDDTSMQFRTQQAINNVSAQHNDVDLSKVDPSVRIQDGPYTDTRGPFEPNASVKLKDGTFIKTDERGWPDTDLDDNGKPDPTTVQNASKETDAAAAQLNKLKNQKVDPMLKDEQRTLIDEATTTLGDAIQREVELGVRDYMAANPDASRQDIQNEAERLGHAILSRTGNSGVISESQVNSRVEQAIAAVTEGK